MDEIRGTSASKGVGKGKAKLVYSPSEVDLLLLGACKDDVLISVEASPDLITVIDKVAGIVIDKAGTASHLALAAREFGIPCVVGVDKATKVFRNGDLVEVNADKGFVKKI